MVKSEPGGNLVPQLWERHLSQHRLSPPDIYLSLMALGTRDPFGSHWSLRFPRSIATCGDVGIYAIWCGPVLCIVGISHHRDTYGFEGVSALFSNFYARGHSAFGLCIILSCLWRLQWHRCLRLPCDRRPLAFGLLLSSTCKTSSSPIGALILWSGRNLVLAVEEQFYLTWPVLVFLLKKRTLAIVSVLLVVMSLSLRLSFHIHGAPLGFVHFFTLSRLDSIAFGSLAALWLRSRAAHLSGGALMRINSWVWYGGHILARVLMHRNSSTVGYTFLAFAFTGL